MKTLFIDTHYDEVVLILFNEGNIFDSIILSSIMKHSEVVMPNIEKLLTRNNLDVNNLDEIIVVNGPGSFTGVRIGVTIAKTIAYCLNIPIKSISSLFVKACNVLGTKTVGIREKNGLFIGKFDEKNNLLGDYLYLKNSEIEEYSEDIIEDIKVDYETVYKSCQTVDNVNPHLVNPLYVKTIEALNDKRS